VPRPRRSSALPPWSLVATVGLAGALALIVYLSVTSLPYLAMSPASDPVFGALNGCVLAVLKERTGFAVSRDGTHLSAWAPDRLVQCGPGDETPKRTWQGRGITVGAYDASGALWLAQQASDADTPRLWLWRTIGGAPLAMASLEVQAITGTSRGVVVLDPSAELTALTREGSVEGSFRLPMADMRGAVMATSGDGERVAVVVAGGVYVLSSRVELLRAEAPCTIETLWWLEGHRALLSCRPSGSLFLTIDLDTGRAEVATDQPRVPSWLLGPRALWIQSCDVLPCTAPPP
jgi:hypothetical protein